jgi:hypothetical protein
MLLELNIKTTQDLDKYLVILKSGQYCGVTITSKKGNLDFEEVLFSLCKIPLWGCSEADGMDIIVHESKNIQQLKIIPTFSCSSNYNQNAIQTFDRFLNFMKILDKYNVKEFLLVSGNPKMKLDTMEVLKTLNFGTYPYEVLSSAQDEDFLENADLNDKVKIGIAYNPYSKDLERENIRLVEKVKFSNVLCVWLQLGQDLDELKTGVDFIRTINPYILIVNSILSPSKTLLKSLQFRPWSGVYYSDEFYNNLEFALQNVQNMQQLSQELGLEVLISGV